MNAVDIASTHGHFAKLTANTLRWTFSQTRKKFEILTHSGNLWKYKWNQTRSTLYKERDFWKIYLRTGQSGCELKIAETRFGHKTIRSPVFPFFLFFFLLKIGWRYIHYIHYEDYMKRFKKKIRLSRFRDTQKSAKSPNFEWSCTYTGGGKTG